MKKTFNENFEQAMKDSEKLVPEALRIIGKRLESDDMVETALLNQAADMIEELSFESEHKLRCQCSDSYACQRSVDIVKLRADILNIEVLLDNARNGHNSCYNCFYYAKEEHNKTL